MSNKEIERRRFIRVPVALMISLKSVEDADDFVTNYTYDLSMGGMFIKTGVPKPIGTGVCLQMHTPPPTGLIEIQGKVVSHNTNTKEGVLTGMGIEFTEMTGEARHILKILINGARTEIFSKRPDQDNWAVVNAISNIVEILNTSLNLIRRPV